MTQAPPASYQVWAYDRLDYCVRIDITSGWLEEILLDSKTASPRDVVGRSDVVGRPVVVGRSDLVARRRR